MVHVMLVVSKEDELTNARMFNSKKGNAYVKSKLNDTHKRKKKLMSLSDWDLRISFWISTD